MPSSSKKRGDIGAPATYAGSRWYGRIGADHLGEEHEDHEDAEEREADHRHLVAAELPPHQLPLAREVGPAYRARPAANVAERVGEAHASCPHSSLIRGSSSTSSTSEISVPMMVSTQ